MARAQTTNALDRAIAYAFPKWGVERQAWREYQASYRGSIATRTDAAWGQFNGVTGQTLNDRRQLASLRARSRRVDRDSAIGTGILNRLVDNVVGEGMTLQAKTSSKAFNAEAEERWRLWFDNADVRGMFDGNELQRQIYRAHERDGDVGVVLVSRGGRPRLQVIEGDQIQTPDSGHGVNMLDGVEVNRVGRPVAFHVLDAREGQRRTFTRVAARDFIFYPRLKRVSGVRGEPCFTQSFPLLDQIDAYVDAVILAARMAAVFGLIFKGQNSPGEFGALGTLANSQGDQQKAVTLENGSVKYIGAADDAVQVSPQQPMNQTPDFIRAMLRLIGLPMDMPLELVLLDFSQTNFSSARASLLQFYRAMRARQGPLKSRVLSRVYAWWISTEVNAGRFTNRAPADFWTHEFQPRGWQWVDPVKEVQAANAEIDMGINTLKNVASGLGRNLDDITDQRMAEIAARRAMELPDLRSSVTRDSVVVNTNNSPAGGATEGTADGDNDGDRETPDDQGGATDDG